MQNNYYYLTLNLMSGPCLVVGFCKYGHKQYYPLLNVCFFKMICGLFLKWRHYSVSWLTPSTQKRVYLYLKLISILLYFLKWLFSQIHELIWLACAYPIFGADQGEWLEHGSEQGMNFQLQCICTLTKADHTTPCLECSFFAQDTILNTLNRYCYRKKQSFTLPGCCSPFPVDLFLSWHRYVISSLLAI